MLPNNRQAEILLLVRTLNSGMELETRSFTNGEVTTLSKQWGANILRVVEDLFPEVKEIASTFRACPDAADLRLVEEVATEHGALQVWENKRMKKDKMRSRFFVSLGGKVSKNTVRGWELGGDCGYQYLCDAKDKRTAFLMRIEGATQSIRLCLENGANASADMKAEWGAKTKLYREKIFNAVEYYSEPCNLPNKEA